MRVVLLVGNPNAGKSTLFNRLTHGHARVGNWHGVTVTALEGEMTAGGVKTAVCDLPGIYSAEGRSMEEIYAARYVKERPEAAIVFVSEYAALKRTLPLMRDLTRGGRRCMLVLTKRRRFLKEGGKLDVRAVGSLLKIPVCDAEEVGERDIAALFESSPREVSSSDMGGLFTAPSVKLTKFDALLLNGFFGFFFFAALLLAAFFLTFAKGMPGDLMKGAVEAFFSETLAGYARKIPSPVAGSLLADGILKSMGGVLSFLPQIALLELFLILFEESGLLSRLAFLSDGLLSKVGLSGKAVFALLMGFGCTAAAAASTRGLDDKASQKRVLLCLPYLSCTAKLPVYLALTSVFFDDPFPAVLLLYALGAGIAVAVCLLLKGKTPPLVMELAPLQLPSPEFTFKSLLFRLKQFIIKVTTVVLAFFLFSWLLSSFTPTFTLCAVEDSMLAKLCGRLSFLFAPAGMGDWRITYAALSGLVAKENVAGSIAMFYGEFPFSAESAFALAVFMLTCSPCVSAIAATARETGTFRALLYAVAQTLSALLLCYFVYFLLTGSPFAVLPALALGLAAYLVCHETIHRKRTHHVKGFYRRRMRAGLARTPVSFEGAGSAGERREGGERLPLGAGRRSRLLSHPRAGGEKDL